VDSSPSVTSELELVTIGTELLLGFTIDTNAAFIGQFLSARGIRITRRTSVSDDAAAIREAISEGLDRTGTVLTTGGLGPTRDDISRQVVAELLGLPLAFDESVWQALVERFARLGRVPAETNRTQAMVPTGGTVLANRWGSAPGLWLTSPRGLVIMLPGVPVEMRQLLEHEVAPRLANRSTGLVIRSATLRTTGVPESTLAERIGSLEDELVPLGLAYLPGTSGVDLRLTAWQLPAEAADARLRHGLDRLRHVVGPCVYGEGNADLAATLLDLMRSKGLHLALAESCTGGLVAGRLTEIPGASDVVVGGIVAYANQTKVDLLQVPAEVIAQHGAVSAETAEAMARGAQVRFGAEIAIAVTGVAGPGGGSPEKPVGTVWFAFATGERVESVMARFVGSRSEIRARAAQAALMGAYRRVGG
jgi:nicotinamide-nucleotide amidase